MTPRRKTRAWKNGWLTGQAIVSGDSCSLAGREEKQAVWTFGDEMKHKERKEERKKR